MLAGISTSIGVEGIARGASERGHSITFPKDAMTYMFAGPHENSLNYIFPGISELMTPIGSLKNYPDAFNSMELYL